MGKLKLVCFVLLEAKDSDFLVHTWKEKCRHLTSNVHVLLTSLELVSFWHKETSRTKQMFRPLYSCLIYNVTPNLWNQLWTLWHPKVSEREIHRFESIQVLYCQVLCSGKFLWGPQRTIMEAKGEGKEEIQPTCSYPWQDQWKSQEDEKLGEKYQERRKETHFSNR